MRSFAQEKKSQQAPEIDALVRDKKMFAWGVCKWRNLPGTARNPRNRPEPTGTPRNLPGTYPEP